MTIAFLANLVWGITDENSIYNDLNQDSSIFFYLTFSSLTVMFVWVSILAILGVFDTLKELKRENNVVAPELICFLFFLKFKSML